MLSLTMTKLDTDKEFHYAYGKGKPTECSDLHRFSEIEQN